MKIKLILAASPDDPLRKNDPFMPLSLPILAGTAPEHDYTLIDLLWDDDVNFNEPVDLVGISARYSAENRAYQIASEFRSRGARVVLGGPQISSVPFRAKEFADAVAVGEGEDLWPVIVKDAQENRLRDFYVASPEPFDARGHSLFQVKHYPRFINNSMPLRSLYKRRYRFDTVFAARGCPMDCDFCSVPSIFGREFRPKPVKDVIAEIDTFRNYYYILDDSVFGRPSTYDYYLELYEAIAGLKKKRYWTGQGTLDAVSHEKGRRVITAAAKAGLLYAAIGMESVNPSTLEKSGAIKKMGLSSAGSALDTMKEHIRFIQDLGIIISGWFVLGYDDDTIDTYYRTLDFCMDMNIIPVIFPVTALPGTRLYDRLKKENKLDETKLVNYRNPNITDDDIYTALKHITARGFSFQQIMKNIIYYLPRFGQDRIHKTVFSLVLQTKLKDGIGVANDIFVPAP
ncbi:MAG TPA: radical SAM protein [Spirochaetota bacterium]|nr:radical SAM protein [Spirochaetota bacterium]HPI88538.1 radical SAM protein [Spirochaetota bacterium]HPR48018.1 radical SAM protein [Spirochaetota bacterium]